MTCWNQQPQTFKPTLCLRFPKAKVTSGNKHLIEGICTISSRMRLPSSHHCRSFLSWDQYLLHLTLAQPAGINNSILLNWRFVSGFPGLVADQWECLAEGIRTISSLNETASYLHPTTAVLICLETNNNFTSRWNQHPAGINNSRCLNRHFVSGYPGLAVASRKTSLKAYHTVRSQKRLCLTFILHLLGLRGEEDVRVLDVEQRPVARAEVDAVEGGQGQVAALERDGAAQNHALRRHHVGQHGKLAATEVLQGALPVAVVSKLCQHGCADTKRIFISTFGSTDTEHSIFNANCNSTLYYLQFNKSQHIMYTSTTVQAELCARCRHGHTHTLTDTHARTCTHACTHIHTLTDTHTLSLSLTDTHSLSLTDTHIHSLTDRHTHTVQTDRGERQTCLTEIFSHRNLWHYLTERPAKTTSTPRFKLENAKLTVVQWLPLSQKGWAKWQGETSCIFRPKGICNHLKLQIKRQAGLTVLRWPPLGPPAWGDGPEGGEGPATAGELLAEELLQLAGQLDQVRRGGARDHQVELVPAQGPIHKQVGRSASKADIFYIYISWCGVLCEEEEN